MKYSKEKIARTTFALALAAMIGVQTMPINVLTNDCRPEDLGKAACQQIANENPGVQVQEKTVANSMKDKLEGKDIKIWKGDSVNWKDGVGLKDEHKDDNEAKENLEGAEMTDEKPGRDLSQAGTREGNVNVKFKDNSELSVKNKVYVSDHITGLGNTNAPDNAVKITFYLRKGTKAGSDNVYEGQENPVEFSAYKAMPGVDVSKYTNPIIGGTIFDLIAAKGSDESKKGSVKWVNEKGETDYKVSAENKNFYAEFIEAPEEPKEKPEENPPVKPEENPQEKPENKVPEKRPSEDERPNYMRPDYSSRDYSKVEEKPKAKTEEKKEEKKEEKLPEKGEVKTVEHYLYLNKAEYEVNVNGKLEKRTMDVEPFALNGRTMVPVRFIAEVLGAEVSWDQETKTASFSKNGITAKLTLGSKIVQLSDGRAIELDAEPMVKNDRIVLPLTNIAKIFAISSGDINDEKADDIEWDAENMRVIIRTK